MFDKPSKTSHFSKISHLLSRQAEQHSKQAVEGSFFFGFFLLAKKRKKLAEGRKGVVIIYTLLG